MESVDDPLFQILLCAENLQRILAWYERHKQCTPDHIDALVGQVESHRGSKCECCEESHYEFLAFNHKHGGGTKHRRALKQDGSKFLTWLKRNNYPDTINILCHNCNVAHGMYGYCPHERTQ